jgi:hypothetical protein
MDQCGSTFWYLDRGVRSALEMILSGFDGSPHRKGLALSETLQCILVEMGAYVEFLQVTNAHPQHLIDASPEWLVRQTVIELHDLLEQYFLDMFGRLDFSVEQAVPLSGRGDYYIEIMHSL